MTREVHRVVEDAQDQDQVVGRVTIDQEVSRSAHGPAPALAGPAAAVAKVVGEETRPELRAFAAAVGMAFGQGAEGGLEQVFIAVTAGVAELIGAPIQKVCDVLFGRRSQPDLARHARFRWRAVRPRPAIYGPISSAASSTNSPRA